jgi:isocitrate dehydrogenase
MKIFRTPTEEQAKEFGLRKAWGSPNGLMRRGWNGISISRDTIHLAGMKMGYKNPCLFDRHAVGGEYGAAYDTVGPGTVTLTYQESGGNDATRRVIDQRVLKDQINAIVLYDNPYDNVKAMGHHFFQRCLEAKVTPYVVCLSSFFSSLC